MKKLLFASIDLNEATKVFETTLKRLIGYVDEQSGIKLPVSLELANPPLIEKVVAAFEAERGKDDGYVWATEDIKNRLLGAEEYLLVGCHESSLIAELAIAGEPTAEYGLARDIARFASVYDIFAASVMHESLHLFGVDDCYDKNATKKSPMCGNVDCLMQYDPAKPSNPVLCEFSRDELQGWIREHMPRE